MVNYFLGERDCDGTCYYVELHSKMLLEFIILLAKQLLRRQVKSSIFMYRKKFQLIAFRS